VKIATRFFALGTFNGPFLQRFVVCDHSQLLNKLQRIVSLISTANSPHPKVGTGWLSATLLWMKYGSDGARQLYKES
jgi:hypothetical protein